MTKYEILLVEDDAKHCKLYEQHIAQFPNLHLTKTASAETALELIRTNKPNGIILDIQLDVGDGLELVESLSNHKLDYDPVILVITRINTKKTEDFLYRNGVDYVFYKFRTDYSAKDVVRYLVRLLRYSSKDKELRQVEIQYEDDLRAKIFSLITVIGITSGSDACGLLVECIFLQKTNPPDTIEELYRLVGQLYHKTGKAVERCIRNKLQTAWKETAPDVLAANYQQAIDPEKGCPTNRDFITYMAKTIR